MYAKLTGTFIYYNLLSCGFNSWWHVVTCFLFDLLSWQVAKLIVKAKA